MKKSRKKASNCQCDFLDNELRQFSRDEGVTMADSAGTLGVDLRTRVKKSERKKQERSKKCRLRFSLIKKNKAFQKNYMKVGVSKLLRAGMVQELGAYMQWILAPTEKLKLSRQMAAAAGKKKHNLTVLVHGSIWPRSGGRTFHTWPLSSGQKESGQENGIMNKEKLG